MQIANQLREFITTNYYIAPNTRLEEVESLLGTRHLDSTGVLELVTFVEGKFGVKVHDEELVPENFDSLAALAAFVERKVGDL
jgi:acyl carrier protein